MVIFRVKKFGEWHSKHVFDIELKFTFIILNINSAYYVGHYETYHNILLIFFTYILCSVIIPFNIF